jgi:GntR family transcriptional regulator / MocR family aminotransferase
MADSSGPVGPGLLVELDKDGGTPLHEQIERSIREDIRAGRLAAGARLPSTRGLASELGISRGVVSEAYGQLAAEGYLLASQGAPTRVARAVRVAKERAPARSLLPEFHHQLDPGVPDLAGFPRDRWLRSLRAAWRQAPLDAVDYPDPRGVPALRESLAEYLGRVHGAAAEPEQMIVCTGFSQGLSLIARWLRSRGVERVALEDPGWHNHRLLVEQAGLEVVPVPVDSEGLRVDALEGTDAAAVIVTPAHQFPTGAVLSSERRAALIEWAERSEKLIVEDDFDSELRYDGTSVGALQGLAPERVAYIGSASKRLVPGMRLGWILAPSWLGWPLISVKAIEDRGSEATGQLALHDFIVRGELDRHLRRMRARYRRRRDKLVEAVGEFLPDATVRGIAAGLHATVELPAGCDEQAILGEARRRRIEFTVMSHYWIPPGRGVPTLLLGYAQVPEPAIRTGIRELAEVVRTAG